MGIHWYVHHPVDRELPFLRLTSGNYDISKLHFDGAGDIPGQGYAYTVRVEGRSSANPPTEEEVADTATA
jgi:hypothetical protein